MFTTPKLLEAICEKISLNKAGIKGIFCGGTEMTPQFHRFAKEELLDGIYFAPTYGNTLMGLATHKPFDPARSEEHTSELQSHLNLVCRLLLEKKKNSEESRYLDAT